MVDGFFFHNATSLNINVLKGPNAVVSTDLIVREEDPRLCPNIFGEDHIVIGLDVVRFIVL